MNYHINLTEEEINSFVTNNKWMFAKTMTRIPHEYCLRKNCGDQEMFNRFVMHIRRNGYQGHFFRKTFIYFDVGPHQYWTMGSPLDETILINRAVKKT